MYFRHSAAVALQKASLLLRRALHVLRAINDIRKPQRHCGGHECFLQWRVGFAQRGRLSVRERCVDGIGAERRPGRRRAIFRVCGARGRPEAREAYFLLFGQRQRPALHGALLAQSAKTVRLRAQRAARGALRRGFDRRERLAVQLQPLGIQ